MIRKNHNPHSSAGLVLCALLSSCKPVQTTANEAAMASKANGGNGSEASAPCGVGSALLPVDPDIKGFHREMGLDTASLSICVTKPGFSVFWATTYPFERDPGSGAWRQLSTGQAKPGEEGKEGTYPYIDITSLPRTIDATCGKTAKTFVVEGPQYGHPDRIDYKEKTTESGIVVSLSYLVGHVPEVKMIPDWGSVIKFCPEPGKGPAPQLGKEIATSAECKGIAKFVRVADNSADVMSGELACLSELERCAVARSAGISCKLFIPKN